MADVVVDLVQRRPAPDHEILLHGDIEVGALEIRGQEVAVGNELAADRGQEQSLKSSRNHVSRRQVVGTSDTRIRRKGRRRRSEHRDLEPGLS